MPNPRIVILAGPNGAGKSTVAKYLLTEKYFIDEFVNADAIAVGLSAFAPGDVAFQAGRIMLQRIDALLKGRRSFAFETTLASKSFTRLIARAQSSGYRVTLLYVALPSAQLAKDVLHAESRKVAIPSSTTLLSGDFTARWTTLCTAIVWL